MTHGWLAEAAHPIFDLTTIATTVPVGEVAVITALVGDDAAIATRRGTGGGFTLTGIAVFERARAAAAVAGQGVAVVTRLPVPERTRSARGIVWRWITALLDVTAVEPQLGAGGRCPLAGGAIVPDTTGQGTARLGFDVDAGHAARRAAAIPMTAILKQAADAAGQQLTPQGYPLTVIGIGAPRASFLAVAARGAGVTRA